MPIRPTIRLAVLGLVASGLLIAGATSTQAASGDSGTDATFPGTGFGAIPDGALSCLPTPGAALDVSFDVSGMAARGLSDVRVTGLTFNPPHGWVGDLVVKLIAPSGQTMTVFGQTGASTATSAGDNSNAAGPYTFADDATGGWWAAAAGVVDAANVPAGSYRTSAIGGAGGNGANTNLTSAFSGVTNPNGTWKLRFTDGCQGDTGTVTAATLGLTSTPPDCTMQQTAVTNAQAAVASANAAVASAQTAANTADAAVPPAQTAATQAQAAATEAQRAATAAEDAVTKASAAVTKAKAALKKAKKSGKPAKVKKARKKLKAAKAALKAADAALAPATAALATAKTASATADAALQAAKQNAAAKHEALTSAQAQQTTANANLATAQAALTACLASRPGA